MVISTFVVDRVQALLHEEGSEVYPSRKMKIKKKIIFFTIVVFYFALPTVSRSAFSAIKCRSFQTNDNQPDPGYRSYLVADMNIQCNDDDEEYVRLKSLFWLFFALWPVLTPLLFTMLLIHIRPSVRRNSPTPLAIACRFFWDDYDESMMFWDVIDTVRKLILTGFIMFFDPEKGSNKLFRLTVAIIISSLYLGILANARPYKRDDDFYLAFVGNFLLICCFVMGIILQLCNEEQIDIADEGDDGTCNRFVGFSLDSYRASLVVVLLTASMIVIAIISLVITTMNAITAPTVRLKTSGHVPNLEMPKECNYHVFMSHVWATGKSKTHSISRKLQLLLPRLKVWLDVDSLEYIGKLEESVAESAVFVLYYSEGYFRSENCRRELYAAVGMDKPIMVLYEGDDTVLQDLRNECSANCMEEPGFEYILEHLFKNDPIRWLHEGPFCAAAMNRIYTCLLTRLPYYQQNRNIHLLEQGLKVPGELSPVSLPGPLTVLVCNANTGALQVAEEIQAMLPLRGNIKIRTIENAEAILPAKSKETPPADDIEGMMDDDLSHDDASLQGLEELNEDDNLSTTEEPENERKQSVADYDLSIEDIPQGSPPSTLLLYLNKDVFLDEGDTVKGIVQAAKDLKIDIVLVHEQDSQEGGCEFSQFFKQTPQVLIDNPYELYHEMATPLHTRSEYRIVSLSKIVLRLGQVDE